MTSLRHKSYSVLLLGLMGLMPAFILPPANLPVQTIRAAYVADLIALDSATTALQQAIKSRMPARVVQGRFRQARLVYKRTEWLTEAFYPFSARQLNGPPVSEGEIDEGIGRQIDPQGFQVIEAGLFPYHRTQQTAILAQLATIRRTLNLLWQVGTSIQLTDARVFDAMRLQVFRIITLGLSGFDSPIDQQSLPEAIESLHALRRALSVYPLAQTDSALAKRLDSLLTGAVSALHHQSFNRFDQLAFIRQFANPLSKALFEAQVALKLPVSTEKRLLSPSAQTLSDSGVFDPQFFTPYGVAPSTPERIALGKLLFSSPLLSAGEPQNAMLNRSCASCHQPERAFTDGQTTALVLGSTHERIKRNTPTLLNAGLQGFQFLDARSLHIEDQINDVLTNPREMGGSWPRAVMAVKTDATLVLAFSQSYGQQGVSRATITNAIAHYVRSLVSLNTRFDRYMRNAPGTQLTTQEQQGFNLFMGKAKCGTCHFYPLFNGTLPPAYGRTESEVIGVPARADERTVSSDSGRYYASKLGIHLRAFKIPGIREVSQTAPYMHNGAYQTLEQVVEFYNKGGGNGLGFALPNQTLPDQKLHLSKREKQALVAFMQTLSELNTN